MPAIYGLLGYPLGHSRSPEYFNARFKAAGLDAVYLSFELENIQELPDIFKRYPQLRGFNITIPHKQHILPFLDTLSEEARAIGAVNCVKVTPGSSGPFLTGYNTDVYGFQQALLRFIPDNLHKALVLGNGGAAKAVRYALHTLDIEVLTVSRTPQSEGEISYPEVEELLPYYPLLVNTTPLGTWPNVSTCPDIPYHKLTSCHYLFDLVYNPAATEFMQRGALRGAHVCNGYEMWVRQAEKNWDIWQPEVG